MPATSRPALPRLVRRILARLADASAHEPDPWLRDDLMIAKLTVLYAANGEAPICGPHVLASYMVLGLHPRKVWPKIVARRKAQFGRDYSLYYDENDNWRVDSTWAETPGAKKPPQSVKLWSEKTNAAKKLMASRGAMQVDSQRTTISVPMAAPSIAELYRNPDDSSSAKTRPYSYQQLLAVVKFSGAPHSVRQATLNALTARGRWPGQDGPANGIICVSLEGMMLGEEDGAGNCVRSTARWRARQAVKHGYWRRLRKANSWSNCRKCGAERDTGKCEKCGHVGRSRTPEGKANFDEFCRPFMYEIDIDKFRTAERAKGIRHFNARTYGEHKREKKAPQREAVVTEFPRKPAQPEKPLPPAPAKPAEPVRNTAAHQRETVTTQITADSTKAAQRVFEFCGLADIALIAKIAIGVVAEAKFQGIEIEAAAKYVAESAVRDQKNGVTLNAFYWRDLKWRANGGRKQLSPAQERSHQVRRDIVDAFTADARDPTRSDGG
jgi:hypothetical protein